MAKVPDQKLKFKLNVIVGGFIALSFLVLTFRIIYITCFAKINGIKYSDKAYNQQLRAEKIKASRGTIYDRNMIPIAQNATVWTVSVAPNEIKNENERKKIVDKLHSIFPDIEKKDINKKCAAKTKYEIIKRKCEKPERDTILNFMNKEQINSIHLTEDSKRYYPFNELASHTIGICDIDAKGLTGIEKSYDSDLKGSDGTIVSVQNGKGQPMPYNFESIVKARDGNSLITTLDVNVQRILEKSLKSTCNFRMPQNRAAGIVIDATNYDILAMATWPGFDLNNPFKLPSLKEFPKLEQFSKTDALNRNWTNKAISEILEPGSTFKILTCASVLESGVMNLNQTFYCSGAIKVGPEKIRCWAHAKGGHGHENLEMAMVNSCNPALVEMGSALGAHKFCQFFKLFGLNKPTGIDTIGEAKPLFINEKNMGPVELASVSFGQSNSLNPLQMAKLFCEVITGYDYGKPHLVNRVIDQNGNTIKSHKSEKATQILSESTMQKMRKILIHVVDGVDGKGTNASVAGYKIAGKSGTAQKLQEKSKLQEGEKERYVPSYIAAINLDKHPIVIMVLIDSPKGEYYASMVAAPLVRDIAEKLLSYYGIPPDYTDAELEKLFKQTPKCEGMSLDEARNQLLENGFLNFEFVGNNNQIERQIPPCGTKVNKNTKIMLYTEEIGEQDQVVVPNIVGLTQKQANSVLANNKLNLNIVNNHDKIGTAISQSPEAGTTVVKGEIVSANFVVFDQSE